MGILSMGNSGRFPPENLFQQSRHSTLINYKVIAGSFRVSVIQRTLPRTTGSLTCVCDHSYGCVYTQGLGTPSQHTIFDSEKLSQIFLVLLMGFESRVFGSWVPHSTTLSPILANSYRWLWYHCWHIILIIMATTIILSFVSSVSLSL